VVLHDTPGEPLEAPLELWDALEAAELRVKELAEAILWVMERAGGGESMDDLTGYLWNTLQDAWCPP